MFTKYSTVYIEKNGLFNTQKYDISLTLFDETLKGIAFKGGTHQYFNSDYSALTKYEECDYKNVKALKLEFQTQIKENVWTDTYILPLSPQYNISEVITSITEYKNNYEIEQAKIIEEQEIRNKKKLEKEAKEQERLANIQKFYYEVYKFHINEHTPVYMLNQNGTNCLAIYVDDNKNINFLVIEAENETEIHTVITYDEIHYYEKAGDVHYATSINANYRSGQSFGGSFVGAKVSTGAVALGGLLLGSMGMAIGALSTYKPATYTPPQCTPSQLTISSEITKIDERSVILNYYSQQHKQYIDIELPQEIYNFLQTYLPEKKYAIVIEKEKQAAISNIQNATISNNTATNSIEDTAIQRLQKLKQLYEMELITEAEYIERKKEILAEI